MDCVVFLSKPNNYDKPESIATLPLFGLIEGLSGLISSTFFFSFVK
jgi:hypothetical protein